jgi:predicted DNA-binding transcriptional regulator YafY
MVEGVQPYTRAERLLNLLMALRGTRTGLDRDQIRAVVRGYDPSAAPEAFERMFERDKDELRAMGVPVATLTDASGVVTGYRIDGDWTMPPLDLDRAELAVLGLAARVWQSAELAPAALNALRKVEARLGMVTEGVPATPIAGLSADSPVLVSLIEACSRRHPVEFRYRKGPDTEPELRHVEPWGVVWWRAHWYLVGRDTDRAGVRVFRASRIVGSVRTTEGTFTVPAEFDAREAIGQFQRSDRFDIHVALAPGVGAALRRAAQMTGSDDEGWELGTISVEDLSAGVAAVLALGQGARVAGPVDAVQEAVRQLDAIVAGLQSQPLTAGRAAPSPGARGPAAAQFSRLLALVPWLAANSGTSVAQAAAHFGITEEQLRQDLGSVITSGADDWTLFDIQYWEDGGVIEVIDALDLQEPLTLTPDEAFALLVALHALAAVPGGHDRDVLDAVMGALHGALGTAAPAPGAVSVRVDLPDDVVAEIESARSAHRALELTYLGAVRDEVTVRTVDPLGVVVVDGYAYLRAHCRTAEALRLFRLDRILDLHVSAEQARPVGEETAGVEPMASVLAESGRRVVVDVPAGSTVPDRHPATRRWPLPGGGTRLEMPVGDYGWARRLVLGGAGDVVLREPEWLVRQVLTTAEQSRAEHRHHQAR